MDNPPQDRKFVAPPDVHSGGIAVGPEALGKLPMVDMVDMVDVGQVGTAENLQATFLQRWGVIFVACAGVWILLVGSGVLIYFLRTQPTPPGLAGLTTEQAKDALSLYKQFSDQWRDSLTYIFDLLVTKTALPVVTLLLGYLFGKTEGSRPS